MNPSTPGHALLVMDMQNALVTRLGTDELLLRIRRVVTHARTLGMRIIFVRVAFRDGHPEIARSNPAFAATASSGGFTESSDDTQIHPGVGMEPGDIVVTKRRVSAFTGSDLTEILRGGSITNLILCGIATSGVVLSTVRQASDLDYHLQVLSDGCADGEPDVHEFLMAKILPRQADVVTVDEWIAGPSTT